MNRSRAWVGFLAVGAAGLVAVPALPAVSASASATGGANVRTRVVARVAKSAGTTTIRDTGVSTVQSPPAAGRAPEEHDYPRRNDSRSSVAPPVVSSTPIAGATGVNASTQGLDIYDSATAHRGNFSPVPADQGLCAGNGYVIEMNNSVLRVFDASLHPVSPIGDFNVFFGYAPEFDPAHNTYGAALGDPSCIYDANDHRFVMIEGTLAVDKHTGAFTGPNSIDIAVSRTANPTGSWTLYRLPVQDDGTQGTPKNPHCPCLGDYPHIGQDDNGVYITTNEFPWAGSGYNGSQIYAISKHALVSGTSSLHLLQYVSPVANGFPGFTVWPSQAAAGRSDHASGGTEWFMMSTAIFYDDYSSTNLLLWRLTNTSALQSGGVPTLGARFTSSERYVVPPLSDQPQGPTPMGTCVQQPACGDALYGMADPSNITPGVIDSADTRMMQTWYDGGRLWGALGSGVTVAGDVRAGIAWFGVDVSGVTAKVATQGYVGNASANLVYPAISVLPGGKGVISFSAVGGSLYPSSAFVRLDGDAVSGGINVAAKGLGPNDDFCEYNFFNCGQTSPPTASPRWGDYSAAVPAGNGFVVATQYIAQRCTLSQWLDDPTCGRTRTGRGNWSTRITTVNP